MNAVENFIKRLLKHRLYPGLIRWAVFVLFIWIIQQLLFGTPFIRRNVGLSLSWYLWWPLLPIVFLFAARFWCAICPFALVNDLIQKWVGNNRPIPFFFKKNGLWIIYTLFVILIFVELVTGIIFSTKATAILFLSMFLFTLISGAFFKRRTWCRYFCPLGGMAGIFSRFSFIELQSTPDKCSSCKDMDCYKGSDEVPGCPMYVCIRTHDVIPYCNLCGNCVKNCKNDSVQVHLTSPIKKVLNIKRPVFEEAVFVFIFYGIILLQTFMFKKPDFIGGVVRSDVFIINALFATISFLAVAFIIMLIASGWTSLINGKPTREIIAQFAYALIPFVYACHISLTTISEFLRNASLSVNNLHTYAMGINVPREISPLLPETYIPWLAVLVIIIGAAMSIWLSISIAKKNQSVRSAVPFIVMLLVLAPINLFFYATEAHSLKTDGISELYMTDSLYAEESPFSFPRPEDAPEDIREQVMLGYRIMENVQQYVTTKSFAHSDLSCSSCHFDGGTRKGGRNGGNTLVGVSVRNKTDEELNRKNNICFAGCMNGEPLPDDAPELAALNAYYRWISKDVPVSDTLPSWYGIKELNALSSHSPSIPNGRRGYNAHCAACHHTDGQGSIGVPPLWGEHSYNTSSAVHKLSVISFFIYTSMPLDHPCLSQEDAIDVGAYIRTKPIPTAKFTWDGKINAPIK